MDKQIAKRKDDKKKPSTGSVQPPHDGAFSAWLERQWRGNEQPQHINVYPLLKKRDREERSYTYDLKGNEKIDAERAVELAIEIVSDCQLHCDALNKGEKTYQITVIDDRRGGLMNPVGTYLLTLMPRAFRPAPKEGENEDGEQDGEALTARKLMLESVKLIHDRDRNERDNEGRIVGDVMLLMKGALTEREALIIELLKSNKELIGEFKTMIREMAERRVEERAVGIDEANAAEDRRDRAAARERDGVWSDVTRASLLEGVKVLGALFPGFGQLFLAHLTGQPLPPPPPTLGDGKEAPAPAVEAQTAQLVVIPEEKKLIDRFIETAEAKRIDDTHTAAEKLFGKDDDAGKPLEPGVFSREQVAILSGVHAGTLGVEALDVLLPDSGKPEAVTGAHMAKAIAYLTAEMIKDITQFMSLRKEARTKK